MEPLNRLESEAMRVLWEQGELKPGQLQAHFAWAIDNGTLRSGLKVLMEKRLVVRRKDGKAYLYQAAVTREALLSRYAMHLAHVFAGGSVSQLVSDLIRTHAFTRDELAALQQQAKEEKKKKKAKPQPQPVDDEWDWT